MNDLQCDRQPAEMNNLTLKMYTLSTIIISATIGSVTSVLSPSRLFPSLSPVDIWLKKCPPRVNCPDIPITCRLSHFYWNKAYLCRGCDKKKPNCKQTVEKTSINDGCPKPADCPPVPERCSIPVYFWVHGKKCRGCDMQLPRCSEEPHHSLPTFRVTGRVGTY